MALPFRYIPPLGPPKPSQREQALTEWRGVNLAPLEKARAATAKSIGQVMPVVFKQARFEQRLVESQIVKVWNHLIDPLITQHAQPVGLARGTLFVNVDSHVWLDEIIRYRRREILERLRHSFGPEVIKKISFRVA
jgi:predicted nucleic acid-binding Zn ribbon protein